MFEPPDHYHNLSQRLSQVLDEIGVNQEVVMKRRRGWMLKETIANIDNKLQNNGFTDCYFGSQTEGSTTLGLKSDIDMLNCYHNIRLIQDWTDWEQVDKLQLLMIQDDTTSPGYCLLQLVHPNEPLPMKDYQNQDFSTDRRGRILLRHSLLLGDEHDGGIIHGPANVVQHGAYDVDRVGALHCLSWPKEADPWLQQQNDSGWPTEHMKRYSAQQGCFVVPVDSKTGVYHDLEWRISTSLAERCLMWNLNITQLRCYILMKMIIKTFLKSECGEAISSFMCKNILFHCIADSRANSEWNETSLVSWLLHCLTSLLHCILEENCRHFIIPRNNLLRGKLTAELKHKLADIMCSLTRNVEQSLQRIDIDDLGQRLNVKSGVITGVNLRSAYKIAGNVAVNINQNLLDQLAFIISKTRKKKVVSGHAFSAYQSLKEKVSKLHQWYSVGNRMEQVALGLITPFICTNIGSIKASEDIQHSHVISPEALGWFSIGLNSDAATSRLKLASALFFAADIEGSEVILDDLERKKSQTTVVTRCCCFEYNKQGLWIYTDAFAELCNDRNEEVVKHNLAVCVVFLPCEINCIPEELKFEMFRSTEEDRPYRGEYDYWMDWAVVDSLPYLHFLQYKVYSQLQRPADKMRALINLVQTINTADNLGHQETALNLLGQCMEQENRMEDALFCYTKSLNIRGRNNAAKWHICRMLARHFRH